ncbi:MAG: phosphoglycerate kinase [Candidatus Caenarcaniphilales bacterium]|nr:phosphoglycerate kinase [Candidatus Caenarcaniphilales bacterium]
MYEVLGLEDLKPEELQGKRAFVRVDFNVPMQEGKVSDVTRLKASLPTIKYLLEKGAIVILASHFGRPKGKKDMAYSLEPVAKEFEKLVGQTVTFVPDCIGTEAEGIIKTQKSGSIALLENVRFYAEEEANDEGFSKKLAALADFYVNDAFGSAHRAHASTAGIAKFLKPAVAGLLMEKEVRELGSLVSRPERPFTSIIGGSKVSSKIDILNSLIEKSDVVLVGGGMSYTFIKAQGGKIGNSICEDDKMKLALELIEKAKAKGTALIFPDDNLCVKDFGDKSEKPQAVLTGQIPDEMEGCDIGPITADNFARYISESKTVLWNGPVGIFEDQRFASGSKAVAKAMVALQAKGGKTVIGGGDSAAAVVSFGYTDNEFGHISTGGGASLEFLEGKVLPGVAALDKV